MSTALTVVDEDVEIHTPDGICDAAFIHPATGSHPGVLFWPDAFGLRPSMRAMAARLASVGYSVVVPNPFYRVLKSTAFDRQSFSFQNPDDRARLMQLMATIQAPGAAEADALAYIAFLDCATAGQRRGEDWFAGLLHGRRAWSCEPPQPLPGAWVPQRHSMAADWSPTRRPARISWRRKSRPTFTSALRRTTMRSRKPDAKQPDAKDRLREAFAAAGVPAEIEVYAGLHGWCVPDMHAAPDGQPIYNPAEAERAWSKLLALYQRALA